MDNVYNNTKDTEKMKRINFNEQDYVITEVTGEERLHTKNMMISVFKALVESKDDGSGFPLWGESKAKLMQLAYVLAKWQVFKHQPTGTPASMKEIAGMLCRALHCRVPRNIYQPVFRVKKRGRGSVVDYYAKLWRENRTSPSISLLWAIPLQFPKITDYYGVFDSPAYRLLQRDKREQRRRRRQQDNDKTQQQSEND